MAIEEVLSDIAVTLKGMLELLAESKAARSTVAHTNPAGTLTEPVTKAKKAAVKAEPVAEAPVQAERPVDPIMSGADFRVAMLAKLAVNPNAADKIKDYLRDVVKVVGLANVPAEKQNEVSDKIDELVKVK